jgi:protoporphyrinogen oxidase
MSGDPYIEPLVLGAGPAGLTAALRLAELGLRPAVLERDAQVGGLARTVVRDGFRFDLGGHRFFTRSAEVRELWHDLLGDELLLRPRLSRIHWNGRFLAYPLTPRDVVAKLGPAELARVAVSYAAASLRPQGGESSFEDWVTRRFGRRLFELFFRSYTEKVWGVPTSEIRAEWAAQRIRGLSLAAAVRTAVLGDRRRRVRSLIGEFHYPRLGPGQMWEAMAERIARAGGSVRLEAPVERLSVRGGRLRSVEAAGERLEPSHVISSLPLRDAVALADPPAPAAVRDAARGLRYRDFLTVALVLDRPDPFPDTWIYVHEPRVRVARIQNFRAWSPSMVPRDDASCVGLEYFCFRGDDLWLTSDDGLVDLAAGELDRLGLCPRAAVAAGHVVRVPDAYPIYDADYARRVATIRRWLDGIANLQQVGRNGLHRYNNSDHSMLTALRAVDNIAGHGRHDVWAVNVDGAYHEESGPEEPPYRRVPAGAAGA